MNFLKGLQEHQWIRILCCCNSPHFLTHGLLPSSKPEMTGCGLLLSHLSDPERSFALFHIERLLRWYWTRQDNHSILKPVDCNVIPFAASNPLCHVTWYINRFQELGCIYLWETIIWPVTLRIPLKTLVLYSHFLLLVHHTHYHYFRNLKHSSVRRRWRVCWIKWPRRVEGELRSWLSWPREDRVSERREWSRVSSVAESLLRREDWEMTLT